MTKSIINTSFKKGLCIVLLLVIAQQASAQDRISQATFASQLSKVNRYMEEGNFEEALTFVNRKVDSILSIKNYYYATDYTYYIGRITAELTNKEQAIKAIAQFEDKFAKVKNDSAKAMRQLRLETASFYEYMGDTKKALGLNAQAIEYTHKMRDATPSHFGLIYGNMGVYSARLGLLEDAAAYQHKSLKAYQSDENVVPKNLYVVYNSLGGTMWFQSKIDSAAIYYRKAEEILDDMEATPLNTYFRRATLLNNLAAVYSIQGDAGKSNESMKSVIRNLNAFIDDKTITDFYRDQGYSFLFQALENYGGNFTAQGDYEQGLAIYEYAYGRKQGYYQASEKDEARAKELAKAKILIGETHLSLKNYDQALVFIEEGMHGLKTNNAYRDIFWAATGYFDIGKIKEQYDNIDEAKDNFEAAQQLFEQSQTATFDNRYLGFIEYVSNFYATHGAPEKALAMAQRAYEYIKENQGVTTTLEFDHTLNLAQIYVHQEAYEKALKQIQLAQTTLDKIKGSNDFRLEQREIDLTVLETKIELSKGDLPSTSQLKERLIHIQKAITLLEAKKELLYSNEDNAVLLEQNYELFELAKQVVLLLYNSTKEEDYLTLLLNYTESGLYHRIRTRLNMKNDIRFNKIPDSVVQKGNELRTLVDTAFNGDRDDAIVKYDSIVNKWQEYKSTLKMTYPEYYRMRYETIDANITGIRDLIPENTTLVRYFNVFDKAFSLVMDKQETSLYEIDIQKATPTILALQEKQFDERETVRDLMELYEILWQPFEDKIKHENVVIIPNGALYNLSFEALLLEESDSYGDMITNSLLSRHNIAYNYSTLLTNKNVNSEQYKQDFIAFTPEFSERMKDEYKVALTDSLEIDKTYLTLLPQPFSVSIAENYTRVFKGDHFTNTNATKQLFTKQASEHKIIHIGTHAESNNISPEFSRLLFAKPVSESASVEDNSLYAYEIYNCDLSSNLAILTACETGKPSYQSGEGMISLAHAFSYAGSESILTSLWKIDEQSSAIIVGYFYDNLKKGMSKPEALRQAKLRYLSTNEGRLLQPNYWAGLVLMGDTSPIKLDASGSWWVWAVAAAIGLIIIWLLARKKTSQQLS